MQKMCELTQKMFSIQVMWELGGSGTPGAISDSSKGDPTPLYGTKTTLCMHFVFC